MMLNKYTWEVHLFGAKPNCGISYKVLAGEEPCWFWRKMQYLILGNRWVKIK